MCVLENKLCCGAVAYESEASNHAALSSCKGMKGLNGTLLCPNN